MRIAFGSAWVGALWIVAGGCVPKGPLPEAWAPVPSTAVPTTEPAAPPFPTEPAPAPEVAAASEPEPTPAPEPEPTPAPVEPPPPSGPFDWSRATADGGSFLAVAVAEPVERFARKGSSSEATPAVTLHDDPKVTARAVFRESSSDGEGYGRWTLELTAGAARWQIVDFATWSTDCAAIEEGFGRDGIRLEARELVPGGPKELVIRGTESHAEYLDACDCTTRGGSSEHVWACGLVTEGESLRPVCWAHLETSRSIGPTMDPEYCACATKVSKERWTLKHELLPPGVLRVTYKKVTEERELATLPCLLPSPPAAFGCPAK